MRYLYRSSRRRVQGNEAYRIKKSMMSNRLWGRRGQRKQSSSLHETIKLWTMRLVAWFAVVFVLCALSIEWVDEQYPNLIKELRHLERKKGGKLGVAAHPIESMEEIMSKKSWRDHGIKIVKDAQKHVGRQKGQRHDIVVESINATIHVIPFVIMAYNRVQDIKLLLKSLVESDFPRERVPLIVSVDGHVDEMLEYLQTATDTFPKLHILVHPYSCHDHRNEFPGAAELPDDNGDTYGNPRSPNITCCKHHFTWIVNEVFRQFQYDTFFFSEEDYVVGPSVYSTIVQGMNAMIQYSNDTEFIGLALDPTDGNMVKAPRGAGDDCFFARSFRTGPMTMDRYVFEKVKASAVRYCTMDEYNWDWSLVHLSLEQLLPYVALFPKLAQVQHIGISDGMHKHKKKSLPDLGQFEGKAMFGSTNVIQKKQKKMWGGWAHKMDHDHCLDLFGVRAEEATANGAKN